jgi:RNA polymerase sigma-70 factor (ECF subfamily)
MAMDRKAQFAELSAAHMGGFTRLAQAYEFDPERRRDLVQEILCEIWRAMPGFSGASSIKTYAYRVAHNVCVAHVAKAVRRKTHLLGLDEVEAVGFDGVAAAEEKDLRSKLLELVGQLKPRERAIALMHLEGFDHTEIAAVLELSPSNVATLVHRIKHALTAALQPGGPR